MTNAVVELFKSVARGLGEIKHAENRVETTSRLNMGTKCNERCNNRLTLLYLMSNMLIINMLTNPSALRYHLRIMFFAWMGWKKSLRCVIRTVTRTLYVSVCVSAMSLVLDSECDSACHALG